MKNPHTNTTDTLRSLLIGAAAGLVLALVFAGGFFFRDILRGTTVQANDVAPGDYPLLAEAENLLQRVYFKTLPDQTALQYGAIKGLLEASGDKHTFFIPPPVAQSEADTLAGTYGGIGVLLRRDEMARFLLSPYPDSPAQAAGIEDGDVLLAVNGTPVENTEQQDSVDQKMRGEVKEGSGVEIKVQHLDGTELTKFIEFAVINVPSVLWRVVPEDERIGYVQILRFTNRTPEELKQGLTELQAANIEALILDLRGNTGGLLEESIQVASAFIPDGVIAYERSRDNERALESRGGSLSADIPLVVLVNKNTASASEIVAGAIRDRQRGILLGQNTYGKGTVQQIFPLTDGSSVHITSAEWLTPNKTPLDGVGLAPDQPMIPDENGRDVETGEAIRYLQQKLDSE
jgi:carboxyl-terminal processing protease